MNFENLTLWKIRKKNIKCYNLENLKIINFSVWEINILKFKNLFNCAINLWIMKKKKNSKINLSNNSSLVILIFMILKFRNIGRSNSVVSNFDPHP